MIGRVVGRWSRDGGLVAILVEAWPLLRALFQDHAFIAWGDALVLDT